MEINITSLLESDQFALSHSQAEGGPNAGPHTWQASLERAEETALLDTPEKLEAMQEFARSSGGWSAEEIAEWTPQEINALFLQWIAGDCRQCPAILEGVSFECRDGEWWCDVLDESGNDSEEFGPFESLTAAHEDASPGNGFSTADSLDEIDWQVTEAAQHEGNCPSNLFRADDGRIFFYLGN
jgi:hypothetical protein